MTSARTPQPNGNLDKAEPLQNDGTILVVDDEEIMRDLMVEILSEHHNYELLTASRGEEALEICTRRPVDLVITDLRMPGMGGIRLLAELKRATPETAVVIITGYGRREDAIQALRLGASNFLLKPDEVESVSAIAEKVLRLRQQQRLSKELLAFFDREQQTYRVPSNLLYTLPLIDTLTAKLQPLGICTRAELKNVKLALDEALVNAIVHGNLEISSELKGSTLAELVGYDDEVRHRSSIEPYCNRKVTVESVIDRTSARFTIEDEGHGFDHKSLPTDFSDMDNLASHGRGLLLIRTFMDDVWFNEKGNRITMVKWAPRHVQRPGDSVPGGKS